MHQVAAVGHLLCIDGDLVADRAHESDVQHLQVFNTGAMKALNQTTGMDSSQCAVSDATYSCW